MTKICVTPTDLAAFLEGRLTGEERERVVRHLNRCPDCFERYIGAARLLDAIEEEEEEASALAAAEVDDVEQNLFHDNQNHLWGTWQPSWRMKGEEELHFEEALALRSVAKREKRRVWDLLKEAIATLSPEDRLIIEMRAAGGSVSAIARKLNLEQKSLYRRQERIFASLRSTLESRGIPAEEIADLLLGHESDEPEK